MNLQTDIVIVTLENCPGCDALKAKHPGLTYVMIPRSSGGSEEIIELKKKVKALGITEFPCVVSPDFSRRIPISEIMKALNK